jgi:putative redox protein
VPSTSPAVVEFVWTGNLEFAVKLAGSRLSIDSAGIAGPSPVEALLTALGGCMSVDVADILTKGRHPLRSLRATLTAERATDNPRRVVRAGLHFTLEGAIPPAAIDRAITLSREKFCSVWHSMRQDIDFQVTFDLVP